jgi:hypothetical protein
MLIPIIFGVHKNPRFVSTSVETCVFCRQSTPHEYIALKKAAHFFWIPLFPFGASLFKKCGMCGNVWEVADAPLDNSFFAYLAAVVLLFASNIFGVAANLCRITAFLAIPAIVLNIVYLFTVPSAYRSYRQEASGMPLQTDAVPRPVAGPVYPAAPPADSMDMNCPQCLRKYQVPQGVPVAICPYCGASQMRRF